MGEKPKHTAGPWEIDSVSLSNMGALEIKGIGWRGSRIVAVAQFSGGSEDPEVRANARLIEAAPELLQVVELVLAGYDAPLGVARDWREWAERARGAISKARGE